MLPDKTRSLSLPAELYHEIILFLGIGDIIALRKTCKYFLALTQERDIWLAMFNSLRATQAFPCSRTEFMAMSSLRAERMLFAAYQVEVSFLEPRESIPTVKRPSMDTSTRSWHMLAFISDRFLLSVNNISVIIWDTSMHASPPLAVASSPWVHFTLSNIIGYADCDSALYLATAHVDHQSVVIYSVPLPPLGANDDQQERLHLEAEFLLRDTELFKDMDPNSGRALLYFPPTSILVLHWRDDNRRSTIDIPSDDPDEEWNGITCLRFCGPYILCFRVRSVEVYPVPTDTPTATPLPMLHHRFGPVCYRAISLSRVRVSRCMSRDVYTIYMLTNDIYQGMLHYRIRMTASPRPSMSVKVLAKGGIRMSESLPLIPGTGISYSSDDVVRRMFVSTWSLGPAGLRGVWVDRLRGRVDRRVVAFTTHPSRVKEALSVPGEVSISGGDAPDSVPAMDGKVIHVISSYDLRDDIVICAVSEWTGRIALGSRVGAVLLL